MSQRKSHMRTGESSAKSVRKPASSRSTSHWNERKSCPTVPKESHKIKQSAKAMRDVTFARSRLRTNVGMSPAASALNAPKIHPARSAPSLEFNQKTDGQFQ